MSFDRHIRSDFMSVGLALNEAGVELRQTSRNRFVSAPQRLSYSGSSESDRNTNSEEVCMQRDS